MGWSSTVQSSRPILVDDIQHIVDNLPAEYVGTLASTGCDIKQPWGWQCYADISLPVENTFVISGSYAISGLHAQEFIDYIVNELINIGYPSVFSTPLE